MLGELQPHVNQRFSIKCRQNHPKKANIAKNRLKNTLKVGLCAVTAPHVMKNTCDNTLKSLPNEVLPALGILHVGQSQFGNITKWKNYKMVRYQFGNFTMGVNNKKVNRYGEFVTERGIQDYWNTTVYYSSDRLRKFKQIWLVFASSFRGIAGYFQFRGPAPVCTVFDQKRENLAETL